MLKLIAILVLSTQIKVAIESDTQWLEHAFPNTASGAEQLVAFVEEALADHQDGVRVVLGSLNDDADQSHIVNIFAEMELGHGIALPEHVIAAAAKHSLSQESAIAVAKADEDRFGFIYRRQPKQ